jgi:hypothetical protein
MKNLPEKIYLNFGEITKEEFEADDYNEFCKIDEYAVTYCEDMVYDTDVEYVRKDVFIKKAEEFIYSALNNGIIGTANIEDFMRLFKKYMEGE